MPISFRFRDMMQDRRQTWWLNRRLSHCEFASLISWLLLGLTV